MSDLLSLAERCEQATGAERKLDILIGEAVDLRSDSTMLTFRESLKLGGMEKMLQSAESHQNIWRTDLPRYTASLDAAMTLVPEGRWWNVGHVMGPQPLSQNLFHACVVRGEDRPADMRRMASTPALALCAAALRARASQPTEGSE